ncbi:MAG: exopolysaccharide biosynthesis polyprenyl glycosylphosphotransferase [Terracidiphilus sp.]
MRRILDSSLPMRTTLLKITEVSLVLAALLLVFGTFAGRELALISSTEVEAGLVGALLLLCLYIVDFYEPQITTHRMQSFSRIIQALGLTMLIIALLLQIWMPKLDPTLAAAGMLLAGACLAASRWLFAEIAQRPAFAEAAIVWGSGALAANIIHELEKRPDIGIRVLGIVDHSSANDMFAGVQYLGAPELMYTMANSGQVHRIIVAVEERRGSLPVDRLMAMRATGLSFEDGTELYEELTGKVWLGTFSVSGLLFSRKLRPSVTRLFIKRFLSIFFAVIGLVAVMPVMLITALLIRFDSVGPVILRQKRVGENGEQFTLFKFRSMKVDSTGSAPATRDDPRCTRVGKWIRRLRIDELPQLVNILRGDMYFIGPRPFVPDQEAALVLEIPHYRQRWTVRPGATGWAQVHRDYCASIEDNVEKLSYDLFYIKNLSIGLDLLTLLKTFKVLLLGQGGR